MIEIKSSFNEIDLLDMLYDMNDRVLWQIQVGLSVFGLRKCKLFLVLLDPRQKEFPSLFDSKIIVNENYLLKNRDILWDKYIDYLSIYFKSELKLTLTLDELKALKNRVSIFVSSMLFTSEIENKYENIMLRGLPAVKRNKGCLIKYTS